MALAPTGLNPPSTGDPLHRMHVARPKSAKGRIRTTPQGFSHHAETYPCHTSPTPRPPSARAPSGPRMGQEDIPEHLNQLPHRPPSSSLNRYRVLPSIGAAEGSGEHGEDQLVRQTSSMRIVSESGERPPAQALYRSQPTPASSADHPSASHRGSKTMDTAVPVNLQEPSEQESRLLLAIRTHSGQRFERHFRPTDTLYTVLAAAEQKTGVQYKDCIVESMEVPRKSFLDLSRSLQECNIPNKSVLCIQYLERD
ncbi:PREDICTED: UBX domain-containing protein 10 [Nanorana parkeri]|uniref:UBX domain-containing protein 10 n=1 Tax=Nanorana parkeri TaxID=125878 RepID=UPI0008543A65|nr:PREDICTED: UBX domain-containing protein 10 [Nanorana parkeri]XP_018428152.1 PREDICTED: UBX domain-containing protein 10 [Nanorana parkeri]